MGTYEHKQKIWDIIKDISVGMLVTEDKGQLRSRPMQLVQKQYDGTLWFFTDVDAGKAEEINLERNVCVSFSEPNSKTYVSMSGTAKLNIDQEKIDELWSPFVAAWYPEGKNSRNVALLEIKIQSGEHWDSDVSKLGFLYEVAKANVTKKVPNIGDNQKF